MPTTTTVRSCNNLNLTDIIVEMQHDVFCSILMILLIDYFKIYMTLNLHLYSSMPYFHLIDFSVI